ncbi:MAG: C-terminal binding protein [Spirochaetales bacterium]
MAVIGVVEERFSNHEIERAVIESAGHTMIEAPADSDDWPEWMTEAEALLVNLTPVTADVIDRLPALRYIGRYGVGTDSIDVTAAGVRGIAVVNQPAVTAVEVSEHTIALWLACMRQIIPRDAGVREGKWNIQPPVATRRLKQTVFGLIGFGRIGRLVTRKLHSFELADILVHDPSVPAEQIVREGATPVSFDELIAGATTISLHVSLTAETRKMINAGAIAAMKRGACIINTSRGGLVDMDAVADGLRDGQLHSVGFDVFPDEPPQAHPLLEMPGTVFSDHSAWYSVQSQVDLQRSTAQQAVSYLDGGRDMSIVNREQLQSGRPD